MMITSLISPSHRCCKAVALALLLMIAFCGSFAQGSGSSSVVVDKESRTGATLSNVRTAIDPGVRRTKSTKTKGSGSNASKGPKDESEGRIDESDPIVPATKDREDKDRLNKAVAVKAKGLTMTLGGVDPLHSEAQAIWEDVTRDFIGTDIETLTKELKQLEVFVRFDSQNPPYEARSRQLTTAGVRGTQASRELMREMVVDIIFDVGIEIESETKSPDANRYVAHAFNSDIKKIAYMRKLIASGDPAFQMIGSVTVDAKLSPVQSEKGAMEIGAIVGFAIMGLLCVATIGYVLYGTRAARNNEDEDEDHGSDKNARTETASVSSNEGAPKGDSSPQVSRPRAGTADELSLASQYHEGNISVAWSLDTDIPQTPRTTNSKMLLGCYSRESSDGSLFNDDGVEVATPVISPIHGVPLTVSPLLDDGPAPHVVIPPSELGKLYDI